MQGHARAQYHLGLAYSFGGRELDWNLAEATRWLTIAARSGIAEASHALQALRATPEDRALGEQLARQFIPTPEPQNPVQHAMSEEMSLGQRFTNPSQMSFGF
jgi:TPR repeat protein